MAKSVKINNVTYASVPSVEIPSSDGSGNITFFETSEATADASKIISGYKAYNANGLVTGTASMPSISQHGSTKILTIA